MVEDGPAAVEGGIRYLSAAAVEAATPPLDVVREAIRRMFAAKAEKRAFLEPKSSIEVAPGHFFQGLIGLSLDPPLAGMKWLGVASENRARGIPNVNALVVLSELATGWPLAILDGNWISAIRTAAMTALAASYLARPDSRSLGFVGCGVQAHSHLAALAEVLPNLARVTAYSRSRSSAEGLAAAARARGLDAKVAETARDAVEGIDAVVSSVPAGPDVKPLVDPAWLPPGAFAAPIDTGRSWFAQGWRELFATIATDDHRQSEALGRAGKLAYPGPFDADLAELVTGLRPGRGSPEARTMFIFAGSPLGDLAVASALYERARAQGLGILLPR